MTLFLSNKVKGACIVQYMLGDEWTIESAGGATGEAYFAQSKNKRLFLKRNSSPFLAVLSAQGIVPKLVWTKRLENGDVITAQEWLDGSELNPEVLQHPKVAELLGRIHHSTELLDMLTRMGKKAMSPQLLFRELKQMMSAQFSSNTKHFTIERALQFMEKHISEVVGIKPVVCHCDLNHNNWLFTHKGELFLIDWDNAEIGDPAIDLGMLFQRYIPESEWDTWLSHYGATEDQNLAIRMHWYMLYEAIIDYHRLQTVEDLYLKEQEIKAILTRVMRIIEER